MILNASHEITLSGLPSDVLDAYVRYKKGTRAIVSWIVQYGPSKYYGVKSLPLKELARLAASLTGVLKEVPDVIHFHFRETILARKRLSKYFRGQVDVSEEDLDTVNHEHFTASLTKIYTDLCEYCDKPKIKCVARRGVSGSTDILEGLKNHYGNLPVEDVPDEGESGLVSESPTSCLECLGPALSSCSEAEMDGGLADDEVGNAIELVTILQGACDIFNSVQKNWVKAGMGEAHFVAAAFVTNLALADLVHLENRMRELEEDISLDRLRHKCIVLVQEPQQSSDEKPEWLQLLQKLTDVKQSYEHYTMAHQLDTVSSCPSCVQKPSDYRQSAREMNESGRRGLPSALVDNIMHLILSRTAPCAIIRNSSPAYADLGYVLSRSESRPHYMRLQFSLHALNLSYCQYLDNSVPSKVSNCRLAALRLTQQTTKSIGNIINNKTCFPCECTQTLAYHLRNLETDLNGFAKHKCWDLYFQSPWVAGNHILEILDLCHYYGMKLWVYRHYVGAVVHSYNVLQQLAGFESVPLLEHICEQYKDTFFPGGQRSTSSFRSCWTRYVGARLKFKKGHKSRDHRDSWCMAIPAHAARKAAGLGICGDAKEERNGCVLYKVKQRDYHLTEEQRGLLSQEIMHERQEGSDVRLKAIPKQFSEDRSHHQAHHLLNRTNNLLTSTSPDSSTALLDHFSVFASCVRIISGLSDATHTDDKEKGMNCICFVSAILGGGDRIVEARRLGRVSGACWSKEEREGVLKLAMEGIRREMGEQGESRGGGRGMGEWCWEI